jgi:hypothetical protein
MGRGVSFGPVAYRVVIAIRLVTRKHCADADRPVGARYFGSSMLVRGEHSIRALS